MLSCTSSRDHGEFVEGSSTFRYLAGLQLILVRCPPCKSSKEFCRPFTTSMFWQRQHVMDILAKKISLTIKKAKGNLKRNINRDRCLYKGQLRWRDRLPARFFFKAKFLIKDCIETPTYYTFSESQISEFYHGSTT